MENSVRATWFKVMDESEILSFDVGRGETIEQAEQRHNVKLLAIAAALESLPCAAKKQSTVDSLRSMVQANEKRREPMHQTEESEPTVIFRSRLHQMSVVNCTAVEVRLRTAFDQATMAELQERTFNV